MTIAKQIWVEVEPGYYMLDLGPAVLYVYAKGGRWVWERLNRIGGQLSDLGAKCGTCKMRHHAATSAWRSIPFVVVRAWA